MRVEIMAPAKVNLVLDVKFRRPDGYHELETVMLQLNLFDRISLERRAAGIEVKGSHPRLPRGEENIAWRAAELFLRHYRLAGGVEIGIEKNIPMAAGLAGGSTDAAAVLLGLDRLLELDVPRAELLELGASLGSDVPFCIAGGAALARGRGEILTPLGAAPELHIVLVKPDFEVSTAAVYQALDLHGGIEHPDIAAFIAAWMNYDIINIAKYMGNVLEGVTARWHPEIHHIKKNLVDLGALNAIMSGSGPTVMGLFASAGQGEKAASALKKRYREVFSLTSWYHNTA